MNNNFELIATELFNDDPKLQIENLKVSIQTQRLTFASRMKFILDIVSFFLLNSFYFQQKKDARIIVGMFHEDQARKVFCEVTSREFVESVSFILDAFPLFFDRDVVNCGYGRILMEPLSAEYVFRKCR